MPAPVSKRASQQLLMCMLQEHNGKKAREQLDFFNKDLDTIKDFITTTQVRCVLGPVVRHHAKPLMKDETRGLLRDHLRRQLMVHSSYLTLVHDMQVNQARIYNHDVVARRSNKTSTS